MRWEYLREEEFKSAIDKSGGLCVMCLGCMGKHGQHMPVGTDSLHGDKIVELLPYNRLAPAKYKNAGGEFSPLVDGEKEVNRMGNLFKNAWMR